MTPPVNSQPILSFKALGLTIAQSVLFRPAKVFK